MKEQLITEITRQMLPYLDNYQMEQLQETLSHCFWGVQVSPEEETDQIKEKETNSELLDMFISAKRVEGCSEKTLKYYQAVKDASEKADLVIANIHWGVEYGMTETEAQQQLARNLINWGVDVVIGSHPHVLQPVEKYGDGIIFYSMGNFVFDQGWSRTKDSMVDENCNCSFEIPPIRIKDGYPEVTNNAFFKKRTYRTLTKNLKDSDYEVKSNTLLMKNAIKIDLNKNNQTDANADNTDVSNDINTTSDVNNTDNNTTTKTNTQY